MTDSSAALRSPERNHHARNGFCAHPPTVHVAAGQEHDTHQAPCNDLSVRELQVLQAASGGDTNRLIARNLGVSEATVKTYWQRIFVKVGIRDRTAAVARAMAWQLIPGPAGHAATTPVAAGEGFLRTHLKGSP